MWCVRLLRCVRLFCACTFDDDDDDDDDELADVSGLILGVGNYQGCIQCFSYHKIQIPINHFSNVCVS